MLMAAKPIPDAVWPLEAGPPLWVLLGRPCPESPSPASPSNASCLTPSLATAGSGASGVLFRGARVAVGIGCYAVVVVAAVVVVIVAVVVVLAVVVVVALYFWSFLCQ